MSRSQNRGVSEWESSKENIVPIKSGRDQKQLNESLAKTNENPQNSLSQLEKKKKYLYYL
jgi:hypothetical protein